MIVFMGLLGIINHIYTNTYAYSSFCFVYFRITVPQFITLVKIWRHVMAMALKVWFIKKQQLSNIYNTVRRKILMGEILTNLTNFQQFINIFPIKIFHLVSYLPLMNLWRSGSTQNKIISVRRFKKITKSKALFHTTQLS